MSKKVTLIPIAMIRPTAEYIYAPSKNRSSITISDTDCKKMQDISVSFADDGISNPVQTPTYIHKGNSMLGRFIKKS